MILSICEAAWSDEAARYLEATLRRSPYFTVEDYRRELERSSDAKLYRVTHAGELVGFMVLRIERYAAGDVGVILATSGRLAGAKMARAMLPAIERLFTGVRYFKGLPCRRGAVKLLLEAGYIPGPLEMVKPARPARARDDLMAELDHAGAAELGGPSIQARPGKLHKGGASTSTSAQTTTNVDRRVVADNGGFALSAGDVSNSTITVSDQGAIDKAFAFASANDQLTGKNLSNVLGFATDVFTAGVKQIDQASQQVSQAYDQAKGAGTEKSLLTAAALATVAIVAIKTWGKA